MSARLPFTLGTAYTSATFCGIWVPLEVQPTKNIVEVEIVTPTSRFTEEWDLARTIAGFRSYTYNLYNPLLAFMGSHYAGPGTAIVCPTQLLHPAAVPPTAADDEAMGHDITTVAGLTGLEDRNKWSEEQLDAWYRFSQCGWVTLRPNEAFLFRTGFKQAILPGWGCLLWDRSGMGGQKLVHRFAGVIDSNYRGEWFVRLFNFSKDFVVVKQGDRIVQGIYQQKVRAVCPIVRDLPDTARGNNGFGSTGD